MNDMLERQKSEFEKKRSRRKLWHKTVSALAAVTVFVTAYSLILPAITMENPACGKEEHTHTQECYEVRSILACGQEETPGHKHDETCYDAEGNLICGQEEKEGHTHTAECYTTEKVLVCDKEEHVHDESCYPQKHVKDPSVNEETREQWESTFSHLTLTGDWAKDVLAIADTQLGYTESASNYITEDGRRKGYTRYGAWYGDSYGDWCAMFVSFCLHYAGVNTDLMPVEADCVKWVDKLIKTEIYHRTGNADDKTVENYEAPEPYQPEPGDLIFFDWENDGKSNHVGLVYEIIKDADGNPVQVKTIEGNSADRVQYVQYALTDKGIAGYGKLPENPEKATENTEAQKETSEEKPNNETDAQKAETPGKEDTPAVLTATAENGVTVTMTAPKESLPASAEELSLTATVVEDKDAKELIEKEVSENDGADVRRKSMLFDIKLMHNGEEAQPAGPVGISFTGIETPKDDAQVFHVDGQARKAEEVTASEKRDGTITAETDHFSVYGVTFTVDFHFGDYSYSILGKSEILLSELFVNLKIGRSASDVTQAVFSNPKLISVEKTADDWKLTSLKAFKTKETLTVTFSNGEELVIEVTDAPAGGIAENYVPNTAKVTALNISKVTGTAPWDANNDPGNDKDASNDVVRSFDNIFYNVGYTLNLIDRYQGLFSGYKKANLYVRATLPLTKEQATFDLDSMPWLTDAQITDNGASQTLTGHYSMAAANFDYVVPSTGTVKFAVSVKAMANGAAVQPAFELWLDDGNNTNHASAPAEVVTPSVTTVSAKAAYDVEIKEASSLLNGSYGAQRAGLVSLAVSVRVRSNASDKGVRGLYVDADEVSFTLRAAYRGVGVSGTTASPAATTYTPRIIDYSLIKSDGATAGALGNSMDAITGDADLDMGREVLPYSAASWGNRENSALDSGAMSVVTAAGTQDLVVTFSGIRNDNVWPTRAACANAAGTVLEMDTDSGVLATGVVQLYYPKESDPALFAQVSRKWSAGVHGQIRVNGASVDDGNPSNNAWTQDWNAIYTNGGSAPRFDIFDAGGRKVSNAEKAGRGDLFHFACFAGSSTNGVATRHQDFLLKYDNSILEPATDVKDILPGLNINGISSY